MANVLKFFTQGTHRLVSGSLTDKVTKDRNNNNALIPEDKQRYEFGVAMRKDDPDTIRVINEIHGFLAAEWANDQGKIAALNAYWSNGCDGVSLKIKDGDKPNAKGKLNDNTVGCYVFYFSNWGGEPPKTVDPHNQDIPGASIKRGYMVQIAGSIKDNGEAYNTNPRMNRCGAYLDADVIRLVDVGEVITGGIDADTAFGGTLAPTATKYQPGQLGMPGATTGAAAGHVGGAPGLPGANQAAAATGAPGLPGQGQAQQSAAPGNTPAAHGAILSGPGVQAPAGNVPGLPGTQ